MSDIFETYVFNVGHGDNILIKFSSGSFGLIDFFYTGDQTEPPAITHLRAVEGPIIIEFVHVSHYHHDHTRGLNKFFQWLDEERQRVTLQNIWLPGMFPPKKFQQILNELAGRVDIVREALINKSTDTLKSFEYNFSCLDDKMDEYIKKSKLKALASCRPFEINAEYKTLCISPATETVNEIQWDFISYLRKIAKSIAGKLPAVDENTLSTILVFTRICTDNDNVKFTFGGDATLQDWVRAIDAHRKAKSSLAGHLQEIYSSFIKVSHHGSKHSSSEQIWDSLIRPDNEYSTHAFFSTGSLDYPNKETLDHITTSAGKNRSVVEMHSTNQAIPSEKYKEEPYDPVQQGVGTAAGRAAQYHGSHIKKPGLGLVAYRYHYDFSNKMAGVTRLVRN